MTKSADKTHGIKPEHMDKSTNPGVDFFRYTNGSWVDKATIPPGEARWGSFMVLRDLSLSRLHNLMQEMAGKVTKPGSNEQKIGDFYAVGMDEAKIEAKGVTPLAAELAGIKRVRTKTALTRVVARLHSMGVNAFFSFGSMIDFDDSKQNIAAIGQAGLGLPERDYYLKRDKASATLRQKYVDHIARMFVLLGERPHTARRHAQSVMKIESALAKSSMPIAEMRDPKNINHKMTVQQFCSGRHFDMGLYFRSVGAPKFESLNVLQPLFFKQFFRLLGRTPLADIKAYLRWQLISTAGSYLSSAFVNERFDFYGKTMNGLKEQKPRWKRVVQTVEDSLGEAIGQLYVARYFPPAAKARMMELVETLKTVLKESIDKLDWMSAPTRATAQAKLAKTVYKIGYPDKWRDYSALSISRNSYVANVLAAHRFAFQLDLAKIGTPVDRSQWYMTPQTVNAYADPQNNEVVFPAAILQPPFFDPDADDATNLGGIMVVIGHELTHLFDDSGAEYDENGNVRTWFTEADLANFIDRIELIRKQFSRFTAGPNNVHLNGELISGEAAADLGGTKLAYKALLKSIAKNGRHTDANGFTDEQRFFIAFGQIWASKSTPESDEMQAKTDPHPAARYRVNGTLAHLSEFAEAFGLSEDSPIMLPKSERCHLW